MKRKIYYDLHLHSCLSPCGSEDMTPNNMVNMALLCGLNLIALTDHNTCGNCAALSETAKQAGLLFLPGMELTSAEEVHMLFYFPDLERAMAFDRYVREHRMNVKNRPEIFGEQVYMDAQDQVVGTEENLLILATSVSVNETPALAEQFGGICIPAHIDRTSYSILSNLGMIPEDCVFPALEVHDPDGFFSQPENLCYARNHKILTSSDAHYLEHIPEAAHFFESPFCNGWEILQAFLKE